jgi:hypothetical protein
LSKVAVRECSEALRYPFAGEKTARQGRQNTISDIVIPVQGNLFFALGSFR